MEPVSFDLCFEHVDNLGAYSIPSETGLLISSDYNRHFSLPRGNATIYSSLLKGGY